jgi:hypothetical protein
VSRQRLPHEQKQLIHRAVVRGRPVPADVTDAAIDYAGRLSRSGTLSGIASLLTGLGATATAITYGSEPLDWLRWLLAAGSLTFAAYALFIGYRARRMIRLIRVPAPRMRGGPG